MLGKAAVVLMLLASHPAGTSLALLPISAALRFNSPFFPGVAGVAEVAPCTKGS